jgi:hypothetical protein
VASEVWRASERLADAIRRIDGSEKGRSIDLSIPSRVASVKVNVLP